MGGAGAFMTCALVLVVVFVAGSTGDHADAVAQMLMPSWMSRDYDHKNAVGYVKKAFEVHAQEDAEQAGHPSSASKPSVLHPEGLSSDGDSQSEVIMRLGGEIKSFKKKESNLMTLALGKALGLRPKDITLRSTAGHTAKP